MVSGIVESMKQDSAHQKHPLITYAQVQKPAPAFTTTALVNGEFKQVSLDNYKGIKGLSLLAIIFYYV